MAQGLFLVGFTAEDVRTIQQRAITLLKDGKTLMEWSSGNSVSRKQFTMPIADVLDECAYSLQRLDPDTYGRRITRTKLDFNNNKA